MRMNSRENTTLRRLLMFRLVELLDNPPLRTPSLQTRAGG